MIYGNFSCCSSLNTRRERKKQKTMEGLNCFSVFQCHINEQPQSEKTEYDQQEDAFGPIWLIVVSSWRRIFRRSRFMQYQVSMMPTIDRWRRRRRRGTRRQRRRQFPVYGNCCICQFLGFHSVVGLYLVFQTGVFKLRLSIFFHLTKVPSWN